MGQDLLDGERKTQRGCASPADEIGVRQVGTQARVKAGSEARVEFESRGMSSRVRRVCAGGPVSSDGVEGQISVLAVVTGH